ncbi:MAG TPA: YdiU family protein [Spongiibacteraceae bacterium]|nr:YdiU family protein [Spongiibacteraceae bacterium]HUH37001.1 YdiU family protein [Spongiibacteraceae bacterium]
MQPIDRLHFDNSYARLPSDFYSRQPPAGLASPRLVSANPAVAALLDLDPSAFDDPRFVQWFSGNGTPPGAEPLAMVYSGHQFGVYNPQLGDGRGLLLGEVVSPRHGRWDLHLKGAGQTPYSRFGDGRAVLRSSIREYLCSEAMAGLGIPTTRALCVIASDTPVYRETPERGATLLRVARSHVRFGHFEYFHYTNRPELVKTLADYVIQRHFEQLAALPETQRYQALLTQVSARTGSLIGAWQAEGFAHGVLNSDNMSIVGETLDYGPFAFLDAFDPHFICNHSDHGGRYAFSRQPGIGLWNLNALAHALSSLIDEDGIRDALRAYEPALLASYHERMRRKLGIDRWQEDDSELLGELLGLMATEAQDYSLSFRRLAQADTDAFRNRFVDRPAIDAWLTRYKQRLALNASSTEARLATMRAASPKFILRNYLAQTAISNAEQDTDFSTVNDLLKVLQTPFAEHTALEHYAQEPPDWGRHLEISCSS